MNHGGLKGRVSLFPITNFCKIHQQMCWSLFKYFRSHVPFKVQQHPNAETIIDIDLKSCFSPLRKLCHLSLCRKLTHFLEE